MNNIIYSESNEGLRTEEQALIIRKLFDEYYCDYIVLDCVGVGMGVFDCISRDMIDPDAGEVYPALSCCNNSEMAARCTSPNADKVIWAIKANPQFNSDAALMLREGFRSGRVRLLVNEDEGEEYLSALKGFGNLNPQEKVDLKLPYINTTLLLNELLNLQHDESSGKVRIFEKAGARKDRYSSLSYNYYVATQVENKLAKRYNSGLSISDTFTVKPPSYTKKAVNSNNEQRGYSAWF